MILPSVLALFGATLCRSTFGFGDALIAMPLLSLLLGVRTATPVVSLCGLLVAVLVLSEGRTHVDWRSTGRLLLAAALGVPMGALAVKVLPEAAIGKCLGVLLICYALYAALPVRGPELAARFWTWPFGIASGWLGGAINCSGPPIVVFAALRRWQPERTRASLQAYFFPLSVLVVATPGLAGLWSGDVFRLFAFAVPALVVAVVCGRILNRRLPAERFNRIIQIALAVPGVILLLA